MKKSNSIFLTALIVLSITACSTNDNNSNDSDNDVIVNNYAMVSTGQTTLYDLDGKELSNLSESDNLYGQDANFLKGSKMSFTDNDDGTITDNVTGLMWQKVPSEDLTYDKAIAYCNDLELDGYDDWRAPSAKELFTLSDFNHGWPYIDITYFPLASGEVSKDEQYWTSTKYVGCTEEGQDSSAFGVNFVTGHIKAYSSKAAGTLTPPTEIKDGDDVPPPPIGNPLAKYIRAVRGSEYGINKFTDNSNGTISDASTGLMWSQDDCGGDGLDWEHALLYAKNSELAGYTDWRLPNVKELQGIVDYSYSTSATDASLQKAAIDPMFNCTQITNEAGTSDYGYYWTGTSAHFRDGEPYYYAWYVAFGQAVNDQGKDFHGAGAVRFDTKYLGGNLGEGGERYYNYVRIVRDIN
ncbi:MAG: DUF1566 domain-containing protein [Bacteroidales bacterium]